MKRDYAIVSFMAFKATFCTVFGDTDGCSCKICLWIPRKGWENILHFQMCFGISLQIDGAVLRFCWCVVHLSKVKTNPKSVYIRFRYRMYIIYQLWTSLSHMPSTDRLYGSPLESRKMPAELYVAISKIWSTAYKFRNKKSIDESFPNTTSSSSGIAPLTRFEVHEYLRIESYRIWIFSRTAFVYELKSHVLGSLRRS